MGGPDGMARTPKPWFWKARRGWYATINGVRHELARGRGAKDAAVKRCLELRLEARRATPRPLTPGQTPRLADLALAYQADIEARQRNGEVSARAVDDYRYRIAGFVETFGDVLATDLRPFMVDQWVATRQGLGPTSRHHLVGAAKGLTRWARRKGHIDADPLADMPKPPRRLRRENVIDAREARKLIDAMPSGPFKDLLTFLYETGCRPGEAARLEARHLDVDRAVALLDEHKTRRKTAKPRIVPLTVRALRLARRLAKARPTGPLFLNAKGNPWRKDAIGNAIARLRKKTGVGLELTAYGLRHGFATDALAAGEPVAMVAEMLGHTDTRMLTTVYSHLIERTDLLVAAASRVRGKRK